MAIDPLTSDREVVSTRVLDAPRERVFGAFRDPDQLVQWWGPQGFTNTFHEFDLRPGGHWRFVMNGPDGTQYENETVFIEIVTPERIVFEHVKPMHRYRMTMTFLDEAGMTRLTWRMQFESESEWTAVKDLLPLANEENLDRLETHLAKTARVSQGGASRQAEVPPG